MQDQNQNPQPNYDFIVNQPELTPRRSKKPLIFISAGTFIMLGLVVIGFLSAMQGGMKETAQTGGAESETAVVQKLLDGLQQNDPEAVNELFGESYQQENPQALNTIAIAPMTKLFDLNRCTVGDTTKNDANNSVTEFTCPYKDPKVTYRAVFTARSGSIDSQSFLKEVKVARVEKV